MKATYNNVPEKYLKLKRYHYFHVFTDNEDQYFDILTLGMENAEIEAYAQMEKWKAEGAENLRIYIVDEQEDYRDGNIETFVEDCVYSEGNYPY